MARFETWVVSDLKKPLNVEQLHGEFFSADVGANVVGVEVLDNGSAASLSGTVTGYIVRADGGTVTQGGTLSSNKASIVLPAAAYNVEGPVDISIKLTTSGVVTTLASVRGFVHRATTDTIVDPGTVITMVGSVNGVSPDQTGNVTLTASNITSGTLPAAQVPNISAAKITSGTVGAARLPDMVGATASNNGTKGAVPAPSAGDQAKVLTGDGTWKTMTAADVNAVAKTGDTMSGNLIIDGGGDYYGIQIKGGNNSSTVSIRNTGERFTFDQKANGGTAEERFLLPTPAAISTQEWYEILTNKPTTAILRRRCTGVDITSIPSSVTAGDVLQLQDVNGAEIGYISGNQQTDGETRITVAAYRNVSGTGTFNGLSIGILPNGNRRITVSETTPWQRGIGLRYAVNNTYSESATVLTGMVRSSAKSFVLRLSTPKLMTDITSASVTTFTGWIGGLNGVVGGSDDNTNWLTKTGVTARTAKRSDNTILVILDTSTVLTNAVNGPCSFFGSFAIKFE